MALLRLTPSFPIAPVVLASCSVMVAAAPLGAATADAKRSYDLPRGDAATTLRQFAATAGRSLVFVTDKVRGETTNAVRGEFTPLDAVERMLAGSALEAAQDAATGALVVSRKRTAEVAPRPLEADPGYNSPSKPAPPMTKSRSTLSAALGWLAVTLVPTLSAQTKPAADAKGGEAVVLSPFTISANAFSGYSATQTLSGTRLRGDVRDIASAMSILTPDFLDDIGATTITGAFNFVPSTDSFTVMDADTIGNGGRYGTPFVVRGFQSTSITENFFTLTMPVDRFNTEQIAFNRGPNSILFGAGSPGGLADVSTKQAHFRGQEGSAELRYSSVGDGTWRGTLDQNFAFTKQKLAVRIAGLWQDGSSLQTPSKDDRQSAFLTATYRPFPQTTVRANAEAGHAERTMVRPYVAYDYYTPWVRAGKPLVAGTATPISRTGLEQIGANYNVVIENSNLPVMNWGRLWRGSRPTVNGVLNGITSFRSDTVVPMRTNIAGEGNLTKRGYQVYAAFIEQRIGDKFAIEIAGQYEAVNQPDFDSLRGADLAIQVDASSTLPTGAPNPYAGLPYIENNSYSIKSLEGRDSWQSRVTASYELDLRGRKFFGGRLDLGRYQFAALQSYARNVSTREDFVEVNTVSGIADLSNAANRTHHRSYIMPGGPVYWTAKFPLINQAGGANSSPVPAVTTRWGRVIGVPRNNLEELTGLSFVTQAKYWQDRVVVTYGLRHDRSDIRAYDFPRVNGEYAAPADGIPLPSVNSAGDTKTLGVVWHATTRLSLFANRSDNFRPVSANNINIFNQPVAAQQGEGIDTGLKFNLFSNRLTGSFGYFETDFRHESVTALRGIKPAAINDIWETIDRSKITPREDWLGSRDTSAHGIETELVFNPTPNWRILTNVSRNLTKASRILPEVLDYITIHRPAWQAAANRPVETTTYGATVGAVVAAIDRELAENLAEVGRRIGGQKEWMANLVTDYRFTRGPLKNFNAGASARWRSAPLIGYKLTATGGLDKDRPFFGAEQIIADSWLGYRLRIRQATVNLRLRIENTLGYDDPYVFRAIDDGTGRPWATTVLTPQQRQFVFSASVAF